MESRPEFHGCKFFGFSEWKQLLDVESGATFDEASILRASEIIQPLSNVALTGEIRRIADPCAPTVAERSTNAGWTVAARCEFTVRALKALAQSHGTQGTNELPFHQSRKSSRNSDAGSTLVMSK